MLVMLLQAQHAQRGGAHAVIIANTEVRFTILKLFSILLQESLFIMSGKDGQTVTIAASNGDDGDDSDDGVDSDDERVTIPTVMLTASDSQSLLRAYREQFTSAASAAAAGSGDSSGLLWRPSLTVRVSVLPTALET